MHAVPGARLEEGGDDLRSRAVEALLDGRLLRVGELAAGEPALQRERLLVRVVEAGGDLAGGLLDDRVEVGGQRAVQLEPGVGVRILGQWPDPDVPGFAAPGEDSAVAKVLLDGRVSFVLARRSPGGPTDAIPVDVEVLPEPTLAAFLAYARERYASGAGLR